MAKIIYKKLESAVLQLGPFLKSKGLQDIELYRNDGPCALGEKSGAKKDTGWDYRLAGFRNNSMEVLAEFKRTETRGILVFRVEDTSYFGIVLETLSRHSLSV